MGFYIEVDCPNCFETTILENPKPSTAGGETTNAKRVHETGEVKDVVAITFDRVQYAYRRLHEAKGDYESLQIARSDAESTLSFLTSYLRLLIQKHDGS